MKKKDLLILSGLLILYLLLLFFFKRELFSHSFSQDIKNKYFLSQDISHEVPGRIFLSDSEIHEVTGYLYARSTNPTDFNFQHPPFIKYLYGFSILLFKNAYYAQIVLGMTLIIGLYLLSFYLNKSSLISTVSCLLLIIDPLFLSLSGELLLDLGQSAFLIFYVISILYFPKKWFMQGVFLGAAAASKFWGAPLFFVGILTIYNLYKKNLKLNIYIKHIVTAGVIFCFIYIRSFIVHHGFFNIIFFELKTLKYWLHHSVSSIPAASFIVFISGYMVSWWGKKEVIRLEPWSLLWPITLILTSTKSSLQIFKKKISKEEVIGIIPFLYLFYLGIQAPFSRYFIIILPYLYVSSVTIIITTIKRKKIFKRLFSS